MSARCRDRAGRRCSRLLPGGPPVASGRADDGETPGRARRPRRGSGDGPHPDRRAAHRRPGHAHHRGRRRLRRHHHGPRSHGLGLASRPRHRRGGRRRDHRARAGRHEHRAALRLVPLHRCPLPGGRRRAAGGDAGLAGHGRAGTGGGGTAGAGGLAPGRARRGGAHGLGRDARPADGRRGLLGVERRRAVAGRAPVQLRRLAGVVARRDGPARPAPAGARAQPAARRPVPLVGRHADAGLRGLLR